MTRVDAIRAARTSPQVSFTEYLQVRSKRPGIMLVFEGKQCPSVYLAWLHRLYAGALGGQIIARGKRNVLALRELIRRNSSTQDDRVLYFVDRDYDVEPQQGSYPDVYVTRGYSIENELISWDVLEAYLRAYFDIADAGDQDAISQAEKSFATVFSKYVGVSEELQKIVYVCRTRGVPCLPGETAFDYVSIDFAGETVRAVYASLEELLSALKVEVSHWESIKAELPAKNLFEDLDKVLDWRGKFHLSFVKKYLIFLKEARVSGASPFRRSARVDSDPAHPSVLGALASFARPPQCLETFFGQAVLDERR